MSNSSAKPILTFRGTLTVLGIGCILLLSAFIWWRAASSPERLAAGIYAELEFAPSEELPARMMQLSILDNPGLGYTVKALGHSRQEVSEAAEAQLRTSLAEWQLLESKYSSPRVAALAAHLHNHLDTFNDEQKRIAAQLASEILVWPLAKDIDTSKLILDCEMVLRGSRPASTDGDVRNVAATDSDKVIASLEIDPLPLSGGGLPFDAVDVPSLPPANLPQAPGVLPEISELGPLPDAPEETDPNAPRLLEPSLARQLPDDDSHPYLEPLRIDPDPLRTDEVIVDADRHEAGEMLKRMSDYRVMQQLHAASAAVAAEAAAELLRRGFQKTDVELARQMTHPDVIERRRFAEQLPSLVYGDIRPWLIWLTEDIDPTVRLTAATLMATSQDPLLHDQLRKLQQRDSEINAELVKLREKLGR